ncbi:hypothetical protein B0H16DRAFT_1733624 [Mycena metata]|uniref:Zn(2)-C6 fungal-type domain-containing protein n=1 Tax=Mycena metata TaxID=1033252 RepID=A0AAD7MSI8_9AGAR|nr:hypothetical protein B0H16DRAFT_1733624 [Mycena metata]
MSQNVGLCYLCTRALTGRQAEMIEIVKFIHSQVMIRRSTCCEECDLTDKECDEQKPDCTQCLKAGMKCIYSENTMDSGRQFTFLPSTEYMANLDQAESPAVNIPPAANSPDRSANSNVIQSHSDWTPITQVNSAQEAVYSAEKALAMETDSGIAASGSETFDVARLLSTSLKNSFRNSQEKADRKAADFFAAVPTNAFYGVTDHRMVSDAERERSFPDQMRVVNQGAVLNSQGSVENQGRSRDVIVDAGLDATSLIDILGQIAAGTKAKINTSELATRNSVHGNGLDDTPLYATDLIAQLYGLQTSHASNNDTGYSDSGVMKALDDLQAVINIDHEETSADTDTERLFGELIDVSVTEEAGAAVETSDNWDEEFKTLFDFVI